MSDSHGRYVEVALDLPLEQTFDYRCPVSVCDDPRPGMAAVVQFARKKTLALIVAVKDKPDVDTKRIRDVESVLTGIPAMTEHWMDLCRFAARYYHHPFGEVALPAFPVYVRKKLKAAPSRAKAIAPFAGKEAPRPVLNAKQTEAVEAVSAAKGFSPFVLFGVTGSGKTEVYLNIIERKLKEFPEAQVLFLVPEINLTPQTQERILSRFPLEKVAIQHSSLSDTERLTHWMAIADGSARIILGTRLSVLAPAKKLSVIIVDEEHDGSYKQQEGLRYSARDLAVYRARQLGIPVVLGSATPSLESWQNVLSGRYTRLDLPGRAAAGAAMPDVTLVDTRIERRQGLLTRPMVDAVRARLDRGEQSLLFLNRRGYAPVVACESCGWTSGCPRCSANRVYHRTDNTLRCHHCGLSHPMPQACPECGAKAFRRIGAGTQRIESELAMHFPKARVLRVDADTTSKKGELKGALDAINAGEIDIIVGTQMMAKGHDFKNLTLVGILNPDAALYSADYRAAERLFALLIQVSGRAGRHATAGGQKAEVVIQTDFCAHPLFHAAMAQQYPGYAKVLLDERKEANLPPFSFHAVLTAESRDVESAIGFLDEAATLLGDVPDGVTVNDPVPMAMVRKAGVERAQLLVESVSRPLLQKTVAAWLVPLREMKTPVRWTIEIDPVAV